MTNTEDTKSDTFVVRLRATTEFLEAIANDRTLLAAVSAEERSRLLLAANSGCCHRSVNDNPTKCRVGYSPTVVPPAVLKPASVFQMQ